jgi:hypothetical protein
MGPGAAVRDVRIAQIYEGTNGIQALDLLGRKVLGDGGQALASLVAEIRAFSVDAALHREALLEAWCAWSASASGCRHRPARMPTWSAPRRWSTCTCSA